MATKKMSVWKVGGLLLPLLAIPFIPQIIPMSESAQTLQRDSKQMTEKVIADVRKEGKVLVFSKTTCGYCDLAKELLAKKEIDFRAIELDQDPNGRIYALGLNKLTRKGTVPSIWVRNRFVGGYEDLERSLESGLFQQVLEQLLLEVQYGEVNFDDVERSDNPII